MARHKSMEAPPTAQAVRIERDGAVYEGTYTVNGPTITVDSVALGSRSAKLGGRPPEVLAKIILTELLFMDDERSGK